MEDCAGSVPAPSWAPWPKSGILPLAILASQISTQRKVNIYNILQEIIQQEGELEEQGVQRLVTIASKEMRETLEVGEPAHNAPPPPPSPTHPGAGPWYVGPGTRKALVQGPQGSRGG